MGYVKLHRAFAFTGVAALAAAALGAPSLAQTSGEVFADCEVCPEMIVAPAGAFDMGAPGEAAPNDRWGARERPQHRRVAERAFAISAGPVTRAEFAAFVAASGYAPGGGCLGFEPRTGGFASFEDRDWTAPGFSQGEDHPAVCLTYSDASAYAAWLAETAGAPYRLISEAEWEYAARAGADGLAPDWAGGAQACDHANGPDLNLAEAAEAQGREVGENAILACDDGYAATSPIGAFGSNAWGMADAIGNVREWTADCFSEDYAEIAPGADLSARGAADCERRVLRGSPYGYFPHHQRYTIRYRYPEDTRYPDIGLRVARDLD